MVYLLWEWKFVSVGSNKSWDVMCDYLHIFNSWPGEASYSVAILDEGFHWDDLQ